MKSKWLTTYLKKYWQDSDDPFYATSKPSTPQQFSLPELYDLLGPSKNATKNLVSWLQEKTLQNKTTNVSYFRDRKQVCVEFFK